MAPSPYSSSCSIRIDMALEFPFATLAELKARLGWTSNDEDSLFSEILLAASGAIESEIGRPARRVHARTEVFTGGRNTIRVRVDPIVQIHSIRESESRDFEDSTEFDELVEGTDYVFDPGDGRQPGETGVIRRINANWMGSRNAPGQVQVVYSGGYKTDQEEDLESTTVVISDTDSILNYRLKNPGDDLIELGGTATVDDELTGVNSTGIFETRPYTIFQISDTVLPTWKITAIIHEIKSRDFASSDPIAEGSIIDPSDANVNIDTLLTIFNAAKTGESLGAMQVLESYAANTFNLNDTSEKQSVVESSILLGTIAFAYAADLDTGTFAIQTIHAASATDRPTLTVTHRPSFVDNFKVPLDLRHACLLQASYEHQSRGSLGLLSTSQRGVSVASGASVQRLQVDLLPEVVRICAHYKRMF